MPLPRSELEAPWLAVVNPRAGGGRCGRRAEGVLELLRASGRELRVVFTTAPGEASRLAEDASRSGVDRFLALGGDGTAHEVIDGVMRADPAHRPQLAPVPLGSGNSFLRDFGDGSVEQCLEAWRSGRRRPCDLLRLEHTAGLLHSLNLIGIGFAAEVAALRNRRFVRLGAVGYVLAVLVALVRLRSLPVGLCCDGETLPAVPRTLVALCNSRFTGGAMEMAPAADPCDGRGDLVAAGKLGRGALLALFPRIYSGSHVAHPAVVHHRFRRLEISLAEPLEVLIDGETHRLLPTAVEVVPEAVELWG